MSVVNKVDQFINDSDLAHRIVHGANGEMVETEGGVIPTYATAVGGMVGAEKRIAALEDGQSAGRIVKKLWAELNALVGLAGQGADVVADAGSHVDPVSAGSVPNQGAYVWNASAHAWEWARADSLSMKASTDDLAREAAARTTLASITPRNGHRWRSTGKTLRWALLDRAGKAILSLDRKLRMQVASLRLLDDGVRRRSTRNTLYSIADAAGHRLFALFTDGSAWLKLSDAVVADIAKRLDVVEPATLRGNSAATDISATANLVRAQVRHGSWFGSVVQPRVGLLPTAVANVNDQLLLILFYGQSNAGGGGTASGILTTADHPHHALTFDASYHQYGTAPVDASAITDLVPLKDPTQQAFAATSTSFALSAIASARGERSPAVLGRTDWYGSQPLSTFVRGTVPWANAQVSIDKAFAIGQDKYGLAVRPTIVWVQGEAGSGSAGGREAYASALDALIRDMRKEVRSRHGVLPDWITWQICHSSAVANGSMLAFRDVARMWRNSPVVLAGPLYAMPFSDGIHYTAEGRMMQGEVTAMVTRSLQRIGTWAPLEPIAVKRTGRTVVVDFLNPGAPLQFDHDWIEPTPSMGFSWRDDSVGAGIENVEITGRDQVTITLSALPTGAGNLLRYAVDPSPPGDAKWGAYRGQLYAPSGVDSPYAALGHQVPPDIRFYCIAFEEKVL